MRNFQIETSENFNKWNQNNSKNEPELSEQNFGRNSIGFAGETVAVHAGAFDELQMESIKKRMQILEIYKT